MDDSLPPPEDPPRRVRRGHGRVTLADIAEQAGVTSITVSRYLREPDKVSPDTGQRIQAVIESLGYVPNLQAGQLASGQSRIVAALIPNIGQSIFGETVQGLTEGLAGSGYELMLMANGYSLEREHEQLRALMGWSPAAVVVTGRQRLPAATRLLRAAQGRGTLVAQIWDHSPTGAAAEFVQIGFSHAEVGADMARELVAAGRRDLVFVDSGVVEDYRAHERAQGFMRAAKDLQVRATHVAAPLGDPFEAGARALEAVRARLGASNGLAFANDQLACGALMHAQALGVSVPQQVAVLGFGDFPIGRHLSPALSTVRPPRAEMGKATAEILLGALTRGEAASSRHMPCELLDRGSLRAA